MAQEDRDAAHSESRVSFAQLIHFIRRVDEEIESLLKDVRAQGNDEMIRGVESLKCNQESMKRKLYDVTQMLFRTINEGNTIEVITNSAEGLEVLEAIVRLFFKEEEEIVIQLNKSHEFLEEAPGKKLKESSELSSGLHHTRDMKELSHLSGQTEPGSAGDKMDISVGTSLGLLTVLETKEESKKDHRSPDKPFGDFFSLEVSIKIEESGKPMVEEDHDSTYSARPDRFLELTHFTRRVDEKIKSLFNDVRAEGNYQMIHDVETLKTHQEILKSKLYFVPQMVLDPINGGKAAVIMGDCNDALSLTEAMVGWFTKAEGIIDAGLDRLRELLEEEHGKKSKELSELLADLGQSSEGGLKGLSKGIIDVGKIEEYMQYFMLYLGEHAKGGNAGHEIDRSVLTNLGLLTITDLEAEERNEEVEEGSQENRRSPDKSHGNLVDNEEFPYVSSFEEDSEGSA